MTKQQAEPAVAAPPGRRHWPHGIVLSALACALFVLWALPVPAAVERGVVPVKRIAYLEAGPFWLYDRTWKAFRTALGTRSVLRCVYPEDAHVSPGWDTDGMRRLPEAAARLMARDDIDLVVGMGTAAVRALLAANNGRTPILGMGMSDPIAAGVVRNERDSGTANFTCRIVKDRWTTMYRVFHDIVRFHTLGVMYQDSQDGRVYATLDEARAVSAELGFRLVEYGKLSSAETVEECLAGLDALKAQGMDAFFIGPLNCFDWQASDVNRLMEKLNAWQVPTFARDGSDYVKGGALLGFSTWNFAPTGEFLARQAHAMLLGAPAETIAMVDRAESSIALNLATAKRIGFAFPLDVLVVADELFESVTLPEDRKVP